MNINNSLEVIKDRYILVIHDSENEKIREVGADDIEIKEAIKDIYDIDIVPITIEDSGCTCDNKKIWIGKLKNKPANIGYVHVRFDNSVDRVVKIKNDLTIDIIANDSIEFITVNNVAFYVDNIIEI